VIDIHMNPVKINSLVEWIINEDDGGDWGGDSGWGGGDSGGASLYSTFVKPFVDVYETSKYVAETGMSKVQLLSGIATYGIMTMFMPFVKTNFQSMIEQDKRRMSSIHSKYSEIFKRTEQALRETGGNYDGAGIFFVLFPDAVITKNLTQNVTGMGEDTVKIAVDTAFDFLDAITLNATSVVTDPLRKRLGFMEAYIPSLKFINEDDDKKKTPKAVSVAQKLFKHQKVRKAIANSSVMKSMRSDGFAALKQTIEDSLEPVEKLRRVKSVSDIEHVTGKKLDIAGALRDKKVDPSTVQKQELDAVIADMVPGLVKQAAKPFVERLTQMKSNLSSAADKFDVSNTKTYEKLMNMFDEGLKELTSD